MTLRRRDALGCASARTQLQVEIALLPALAAALPVDVPVFEHISRSPLFVGYRLIRGEPLVDEDADGVRAFLEALHALDPSGLPVEHRDWIETYRRQCSAAGLGSTIASDRGTRRTTACSPSSRRTSSAGWPDQRPALMSASIYEPAEISPGPKRANATS